MTVLPGSPDPGRRAGRPRLVRDRETTLITVAASVGLVLVLLVSMGVALFASTVTSVAETAADAARTLSDHYAGARYLVGVEESLERQYRLEPASDVRRAHSAAARELAGILEGIVRTAPPANVVEAHHLIRLQQNYLASTLRLFAAVDAHDSALALTIGESGWGTDLPGFVRPGDRCP